MKELTGDQPEAFESIKTWLIMSGGGMHLLTGVAGTGKSFLLIYITDYIKGKVIITSPTHKSLKVLKQFIGADKNYATIHSALGMKEVINSDGTVSFQRDPMLGCPADNYTHIIVDEASMLDDTIFYELVNFADQGKKILFVGDPLQIPPVNHENSLPFDKSVRLQYNIKVSKLQTIIRQAQDNPLIQFAWDIRTNIHERVQILKRQEVKVPSGSISFIKRTNEDTFFHDTILPLYKSSDYEKDIDHVKTIAWRNKIVDRYNKIIREYLFGPNLPKIIVGDKLIMDAPVINEEKRILIGTNEEAEVLGVEIDEDKLSDEYILKYYKTTVRVYNGGIFNQYLLRILHEDSEPIFKRLCELQIALAKSYSRGSFQARSAWIDYYAFVQSWHQIKYSYCITAHRSQGSTYQTAVVLEYDIKINPNVYERNRIFYTACTRPSKDLFIVS